MRPKYQGPRNEVRAMKILRSVTRRGFNVGTAGWFTVLRPNTWFPATRLPASVPHLGHRSRVASEPAVRNPHTKSPGVVIAPRIITLNGHDRQLLRRGLIVLAAMAITSILLLWIIHPI
jgi:hypothetical protein